MAWRLFRKKHVFCIAIIIATCFLLILASPVNLNGPTSLYGPGDKVFLLNVATIKKHVFESDRGKLLFFVFLYCVLCTSWYGYYESGEYVLLACLFACLSAWMIYCH